MNEVLYKKVGKRYKPVAVDIVYDSYPIGSHLLVVSGNGQSRLLNVVPDAAPFIAASKAVKDAMVAAMHNRSMLRPTQQTTMITQEQRDLLDKLRDTGFNESRWEEASLHEIAEAGIEAVKESNQHNVEK